MWMMIIYINLSSHNTARNSMNRKRNIYTKDLRDLILKLDKCVTNTWHTRLWNCARGWARERFSHNNPFTVVSINHTNDALMMTRDIQCVYMSHNTIVGIEILKVNGGVAEVSFSRQWAVAAMWSPAWVASVAVDGQRQQQEAAHDTAGHRTHRDAIVQQRRIGSGGRYQRPYTQHTLQLTTSALRVFTSLTWLHVNFWMRENIVHAIISYPASHLPFQCWVPTEVLLYWWSIVRACGRQPSFTLSGSQCWPIVHQFWSPCDTWASSRSSSITRTATAWKKYKYYRNHHQLLWMTEYCRSLLASSLATLPRC